MQCNKITEKMHFSTEYLLMDNFRKNFSRFVFSLESNHKTRGNIYGSRFAFIVLPHFRHEEESLALASIVQEKDHHSD